MMVNFFRKQLISEDSRAHRRIRSFCLIKLGFLNDPTHKKLLVNPKNISAGGTLFISEKNIPKGTMLELEIYLPPLKDFFTAVATVVHTAKIRDIDQYWIRTRFTAIDPADKNRINSYIEDVSQDPSMHRYLDKKAKIFRRQHL